MIYQWKDGARHRGNAQKVGEKLEGVRQVNGGLLTPQAVVATAKAKRSELHSYFEWDNDEAAVKYREEQARALIRSVLVVIDEGGSDITVRAFVNITIDDDTPYTSIITAMSDDVMRQQILTKASKEFESWRRRYEHLEELAEVFAAMDKVAA